MVSKSNVVSTNTVCTCGNGDSANAQPNYFENKCPACGVEGKLVVETTDNVEIDHHSEKEKVDDENVLINTPTQASKVVCKDCGEEFCGQDGYDLQDSYRASLTTVNPNDISNEEDEDEEASTTDEGETTYMSGWEGLCDLLKPLDGQAMMVQRGDFVVVKRIEMPQSAELWAYEGINVVDDSVSITDYTPEIYNTFIIKWGESFENELEFTFNKHKNMFGERKVVIEAKKYQVVDDKESSDENGESNEDSNSSTGTNSDNNSDSNDKDKNEDDNSSIANSIFANTDNLENVDTTGANGTGLTDEATGTGDSENAPKTEEVPITDREEAIRFGMTEVGKAKREDGHTIELKVIGNNNWQMGEWCHVRLPSFNEDSYMFISKCSFESGGDSEYINSLTLVDYPPSLGKPDKKKQEEQEEGSDTDSSSSDTNSTDSNSDTNSDNNDNNSDSGNSDSSNTGNNSN